MRCTHALGLVLALTMLPLAVHAQEDDSIAERWADPQEFTTLPQLIEQVEQEQAQREHPAEAPEIDLNDPDSIIAAYKKRMRLHYQAEDPNSSQPITDATFPSSPNYKLDGVQTIEWDVQPQEFPEYIGALGSSMATHIYQNRVFLNNAANANVPGYKQNQLRRILKNGRVIPAINYPWRQATPQYTGRSLDVLLEDPNAFFVVEVFEGVYGLTRDGRFHRSNTGQWLSISGNYPVIAQDGSYLHSPADQVSIDGDGYIFDNREELGQLKIRTVNTVKGLWGFNNTTFYISQPELTHYVKNRSGLVRQGYLESSDVDILATPSELMQHNYEATAKTAKVIFKSHEKLFDAAGTE